ncbi:MAG: hypothetical protein KDA41_21150, partial [Planctomycetales bacterium]|nr:hypothetical protein [Planctomycetales bacterium]
PDIVDTNILIFRVGGAWASAAALSAALQQRGVAVLPFGPRHVRAVTHLDVSRDQIEAAGKILAEISAA